MIPDGLWTAMQQATAGSTRLVVPREARVAYLRGMYRHFETTHTDALLERLEKLAPLVGRVVLEQWRESIEARDWDSFVEGVLRLHYDSSYQRACKRDGRQEAELVELKEVSTARYAALAMVLRANEKKRSS